MEEEDKCLGMCLLLPEEVLWSCERVDVATLIYSLPDQRCHLIAHILKESLQQPIIRSLHHMNHHQSQQFFTQLIEETAPTCQPFIGGIADFQSGSGLDQSEAIQRGQNHASKAGMELPASLVIQDSQPAVAVSYRSQSVYDDDAAGPFPENTMSASSDQVHRQVGLAKRLIRLAAD